MFGVELIDFCNNNNLCFIDREKLPPDSFTFVSQAHGTTSWLDHCITTTSGQSIRSNISIIDDIVFSDHFPLCIEIVCDVNKLHDAIPEIKSKTTVKWHTANEVDKQRVNTKTKHRSCQLLQVLIHLQIFVFLLLMLVIRLMLFQAGTNTLKSTIDMLRMPSGGEILTIDHNMVQYMIT